MAQEIKRSYRFSLRSSLYLTLVLTLILGTLALSQSVPWYGVLGVAVLHFVLGFLVLQYRVERFIYRRIKKIYDDVSILEESDFRPDRSITTDMKTLTEEIEKFAEDKKLEINTLRVREEYRKEFLGNVAHEMKTPLFMAQGYIDTLLDGAKNDPKVRDKYLQRASDGLERLVFIVKDLDLITRFEVGDMSIEKEPFDIIALVQKVFGLMEMSAAKKEITLTFDRPYDEPIYVLGEEERIQQVITNLLINSIKYGHEKGTTEVSVENLVRNKVIVRVTDNGEGIPPQLIPRLFERFYRIDKTGSRKEGGSGLGLSIVKHIIEAHGERIYVESEEEVGSEFSFTLEKAEKSKE